MSDTPQPGAIPQPDLSQAQNPKAQAPQPVSPDQVRQGQSGSNLQKILAYLGSQGVQDDQTVASIGGLTLKLSDLKAVGTSGAPPSPPPSQPQQSEPIHEDEFKP